MLAAFALVLVVSFLLTLNLTPRVARWAVRAGFLDFPDARKRHGRPVPYGGGVAVAAGLITTILGGVMAVWLHSCFELLEGFPGLDEHLGGILHRLPRLMAILLGGTGFLLIGLVDDKIKLTPRFRLAVETLVALSVSVSIEPLSLFLGEGLAARAAGYAATTFWIVAIANMFNLLDHFDGISAGVALIAGLTLLVVALVTEQLFLAAMLSALIGALGAFLVFNFPPAKIFLGDAGSLFIGYMLAILCVDFTFYRAPYPLYSYLVPFAVLAVPMFDTGVVCVLRIRAGRSILEADRRHLAHRLSALGLPPRAVVAVVYGLTMISGIGATLMYQVNAGGAMAVVAQILGILIIVTVLERAGRHGGNA